MTTTHRIIKALLLLCTFTCLLWLFVAYGEAQASTGACSVETARKADIKAAAVAREAHRVYVATRQMTAAYSRDGFTSDDGVRIGRWVRLLRQSGFRWPQIGQAIAVLAKESRGADKAKNPFSTASGLCQWLAFWFDGTGDYGWVFDPFVARTSLRYFERVVNHTPLGWTPWNPVPSPRWWPSW